MKRLLVVALLVGIAGCNDIRTYDSSTSPSSPNGGSNPPSGFNGRDVIEYRVNGIAPSATIRYFNSFDGLTQVVTTIPFSTRVELKSTSLFLSLDASTGPFNVSTFLSVQIFVNGIIFKEASTNGLNPSLSVSGTYRQ